MKKLIKLTILPLLVLTVFSCSEEEFLDEKSPDQLTSQNFWRNADDARSGLVAAYSELEARSNFWNGWQEGRPVVDYFRSDYVLPGPDASNYSHWMSIYNFNYTDGHIFLDVLWETNYKGINFANQVISNVGKMTAEQISEAEKERIIGEATFLRGYYHFRLLTLYEQIITRTETINNENTNKPLSTRSETWELILNDFKTASEMLDFEVSSENLGHANKGAALSYLGKAYLFKAGDESSSEAGDYENAAAAFQQVIDSGIYNLEPDFESLFNGENENNQESIFELQFKSADASSNNYTRLHAFVADWAIGGWGGIEANYDLVEEMKQEGKIAENDLYDNRLYATLYFDDPYFNDPATNRMEGSTWDELIAETYGSADAKDNSAYFRKWLPVYVYNNGYVGVNVVLMRYADVLLMQAEALNELGKSSEAMALINEVRAVHGNMPALNLSGQEEIFQQIIHERTMELTLESTRFYDLRRWDLLEAELHEKGRTGFNADDHAYFPVPLSEKQTNTEI
ncbi:RagB/SusD family nutrient uptake outer membrane protein [Salinimicrobium oceani]|uniref:RagB/SusD family nutrient uptake outer membrane protein n=1 Tax=Salinimicrobium oceani TaxID=2722702 RepID=A0ABX1CU16_9FLAO|nr:RagB/SusD family nutrient uptake outer membrane protein [Salinimicrobium oceani]NJW51790.1 RagB/SusD family nutrient uptake outer membrane protein [Salinimicrobium oceani]